MTRDATGALVPDAVVPALFAGVTLRRDQVEAALAAGLLRGQRVGVLAESAQHVRVLPDVVREAAHTKLFVTRPVDVLPASRIALAAQHVGPVARVVASLHRWRAVPEPELRRKVTPLGRAPSTVVSSRYLRAVQHPSCQVVAWPVAGVVPVGVRTADGLEHHLDVLVVC